MRSNPGGQLAEEEIIGRKQLIKEIWERLDRQSIVLTAERRMGKTTVVKKMNAEERPDILTFYHDLEAVRAPLEFVEIIFHDAEGYLGLKQRTATRARQLLRHLSGLEIGGVVKLPATIAPHWKTLLNEIFADLMTQADGRTVICFWDELPLMLYNIKERQGEGEAMEVLDTLRALRQSHRDLRMVFTGSVGLHNVIGALKRGGYANDPTNDMYLIDVPPLAPADGRELVRQLLVGERVKVSDMAQIADQAAEAVDHIPYFIHHLVGQLKQQPGVVTPEIVRESVDLSITDAQDRWHLKYYQERITTYYLPDEIPLALGLLDVLAIADSPLPFKEIFNLLSSRMVTTEVESARAVLTLLQRDHYLVRQPDGAYRFRFPLIKKSWKLHRDL